MKGLQKTLSILLALCMLLSMIPATFANAATPDVVYLKPNSEWLVDGARFAAYFFGDGEKWVSMTDSDGDGYYEATVPSGFPSVIFCRMNGGTSANNWDNKWNQTADLTLPTDGKNCWTLNSGDWDGGGSWGTHSATPTVVEYYLFGYINGANYACEEDADTLGIYKFADGKLTTTFESDSYVAVKTTGNAAWYMTDGYDAAATSATLYNTESGIAEPDKLFVPGGVQVTFSLVVNSDDTLTLSYTGGDCAHNYEDGKCSLCGKECTHNWANGTCLVCGMACTHTSHSTDGVCTDCGMTVSHSFTDGVCSVCKLTCEHTAHSTDGVCTTCGKSVGHSLSGGVCTVCGYGCTHSWSNGTCGTCGLVCGHTAHSTDGKCTTCGMTVSHDYQNGTCGVCGKTCTHSWSDGKCGTCGMVCSHSYQDDVCTICGMEASANSIKLHFVNTLGWDGAVAYAWINSGSSTKNISGWEWPGNVANRDADGYFTIAVDYVPVSGESLGVLFHNFNGVQTADITLSYSQLSTNKEFWIKPSTSVNSEDKHTCAVSATESGHVISPEINGTQVTFRYQSSSASKVYLAGSFNNWSTSATPMTKSGNVFSTTVTLAEGAHEYKFVVDGEWILDPNNGIVGGYDENNVVVVSGNAAANGKITVNLHFYRSTGYTGWDVWFWDANGSGAGAFQTVSGDKGMVATYTVDGGSNVNVGYTVRKTDWTDKEFYDRFIDLSDVASGTVHYFLNSGSETGVRVLGNDVISATKPTYANLDYDSGTIWVKTPLPVKNPSTAFSLVDENGKATDITVTGVEFNNNGYSLTLSRSLSINEVVSYRVKCGTLCAIKTDGVFYSSKFEQDYTYYGDDLGATWSKNATTFKVWAPTASKVQIQFYKGGNYGGNDRIRTVDMTAGAKGVWSATVPGDWNGTYYTYTVTFPTYSVETVDPYARSTGANGDRGMILDMSTTDPEGWATDVSPNIGMNYTDAIIYEMHVREMTIDSSSGVEEDWRGTFMGLTQTGTNYQGRATGLDHLKELGVTHVQLMPVYDFASNDEYHLEDWEQYAWGYDPEHYNVPEGSYSTDPFNGEVRVNEFKQMVQAFHSSGINVVMDVVYNHTFSGGDWCYNRIVPNYFSRFWGENNWSNGSGCGNDVATERAMARNYIVDSVLYWVEEYHIDGFRFDLAGLIDTQTMNEIINTVHAKYPYVIFYGEGWGVGDTAVQDGYALSTKGNSWMTPGMSFYNDDFRNDIAGNNGGSWGFATGDSGKADAIANYFRASNGWSTAPTQTINYVASHDNYSLFDKINISRNGAYYDEMVRMNNLSAAIYMMAQGTPYIYSGEELLREKINEDGYRVDNAHGTNDYVNKIRWSDLVSKESAQLTDDYYAGLIAFRKNHAALRCADGGDAWNYTTYHKINDQCVMFYVNGYPNYECSDGIVIIYNASNSTQWVDLYNYGIPHGNWQACVHGTQAGTSALWSVNVGSGTGTVGVEGISTTILVLGDLVHEESVYNQQNQYISCTHASHNTAGLCTKCGSEVGHTYTSGKCSVCGLSEAAPETITVYYDNAKTKWSSVNAYAWTTAGVKTQLYCGAWPGSAMTHVSGTIYAITLPVGAANIIFNDGGSNQTADLTAPAWDSGKFVYDSTTAEWIAGNISCDHPDHDLDGVCTSCLQSVSHSYENGVCTVCGGADPDYVPVVDYYLFGYINGANYACEEDYENLGIYKFVDGQLIATFESDSYVAVKTGDNGVWYMTDGYQSGATSVTLYDTEKGIDADKLFVPGGVEVTFTLTVNDDDTLTLSYTTKQTVCDHSYTSAVTTEPSCTESGVKTYTCSKCGDSYTEEIATLEHNYENGTCTVCGGADPDYVPVVQPTIQLKYPSLTFESEVYINLYFYLSGAEDVVQIGMIRSDDAVAEVTDELVDGFEVKTSGSYTIVRSPGIPAKELGESKYIGVYAKLTDGSYVFTKLNPYSALAYAKDRLANSTNENLKKLCVAMLNYGAAAQTYMNYNVDTLANASLTADQLAMVEAYNADMVAGVTAVDSSKVGIFTRSGFGSCYPSVSFEGAFAISYYFTPSNAPENGMKLYYWDLSTYATVDVLTKENATGVVEMTANGSAYKGDVTGIAAKEIDQTVFVSGVYEVDGVTYTTGVLPYSLGAYCVDRIAKGSANMQALAAATAVYGYYAKIYFAN